MKFFAAALICLAGLPALRATPVWDLQRELKLDDTGWLVQKATNNSILWVTPQNLVVTLVIQNGKSQEPGPNELKQLRDSYRQQITSQHGNLVEADFRHVGGIVCDLVTIKYLPADIHASSHDPGGFTYQTRVVIPTTLGNYELDVVGTEQGVTGLRDTTGLVIYMKEKGIPDIDTAVKSFNRDPYDPAYDKDAHFAVSDERRFDKDFPQHPLSQCRAQMDKLLGSLTISERIRKIALYPEKGPSPAVRSELPNKEVPSDAGKEVPSDAGAATFTLEGNPGVTLTLDGNYTCLEADPADSAAEKKARTYMFNSKDDQSALIFQVGSEVTIYTADLLKERYHVKTVRKSSGEINGNRVDWLRCKDDTQHFYSATTVSLRDEKGAERTVAIWMIGTTEARRAALEKAVSSIKFF